MGDEALNGEKRENAIAAYSAALSLGPPTSSSALRKWTNALLTGGSADGALSSAAKVCFSCGPSTVCNFFSDQFKFPRFTVYRSICDVLERDGRLTETVECFRKMQNDLADDLDTHDERAQWELGKGPMLS